MEHELHQFEQGPDPAQRRDAFSGLIKLKQHHRASKDSRFAKGVQALAESLRSSNQPHHRLEAAALLLRIGGLIKSWTEKIRTELGRSLDAPLPPLNSAPDPDDRYYLATCWRFADRPWTKTYLASGAVQEEGSEPVRSECIEGLLTMSGDLAETLGELCQPARRLNFDTEKPGDSKARRIRRILEALNSVYAVSPKEPGDAAGQALRKMLVDSLANVPPVTKQSLTDELAEEVLKLIQGIVRARFSYVTSEDTYAAMEVVRGWYRDHTWQMFAEDSRSARLIARDLKEALELLIRAGVPDSGLYSRMTAALGTEAEARKAAVDILHHNPGLPEDLARWLSGQPARKKSVFATETEGLQFDEFLADLLVDCARLKSSEETFERDSLPEMNVLAPHAGAALERLFGQTRSIRNAVDTAVRVRSLSLRGAVGDIVEFLPTEHEMVHPAQAGARSVRVIRPGVDAPSPSGGRRVVRKAIVEPVQ
jgi:hypothetical protein